jgi:hypothetical protein
VVERAVTDLKRGTTMAVGHTPARLPLGTEDEKKGVRGSQAGHVGVVGSVVAVVTRRGRGGGR